EVSIADPDLSDEPMSIAIEWRKEQIYDDYWRAVLATNDQRGDRSGPRGLVRHARPESPRRSGDPRYCQRLARPTAAWRSHDAPQRRKWADASVSEPGQRHLSVFWAAAGIVRPESHPRGVWRVGAQRTGADGRSRGKARLHDDDRIASGVLDGHRQGAVDRNDEKRGRGRGDAAADRERAGADATDAQPRASPAWNEHRGARAAPGEGPRRFRCGGQPERVSRRRRDESAEHERRSPPRLPAGRHS